MHERAWASSTGNLRTLRRRHPHRAVAMHQLLQRGMRHLIVWLHGIDRNSARALPMLLGRADEAVEEIRVPSADPALRSTSAGERTRQALLAACRRHPRDRDRKEPHEVVRIRAGLPRGVGTIVGLLSRHVTW